MKKLVVLVLAVVLALATFGVAAADPIEVNLYVDAAPNVYGSPDYATWQAAAYAAAANGTFVNMANSSNPGFAGSTNFTIEDEVVYSFGDLGHRLTWIYWIPDTTIAQLQQAGFEISLHNWWDGEYLDMYADYYGSTWLEPTKWVAYNGGVIGTSGMAWWGAYQVNTPEALAADIAEWGKADETWELRYRFANLDQEGGNIVSNREGSATPEPGTMLLLGSAAGALGWFRRRRSNR